MRFEAIITEIITRKHRLDELRKQSPEIAEALTLADEYHELMDDLREMCNPHAQVVPYPTTYPIWSPVVYTSDNTATIGSRPKLKLIVDGKEIP